MRVITFFLVLICSISVQAQVIVDHLAITTFWDNAPGYPDGAVYGQSFISDGQSVVGVDIYIENYPGNPIGHELYGPADLMLYDITNLSNPVLLATSRVVEDGKVVSGLVALNFDSPVYTTSGKSYCFTIGANNGFGIGLRALNSSTYPGGSECFYVYALDEVQLAGDGRDLSFKVRGVEPTPERVVKTGQTTCYDISGTVISCVGTGQDGEYQKGVVDPVSRYTDNLDGTITDNKTGLIWVKQVLCSFNLDWNQALDHANNLADGECGLTDGSEPGDWRLPNYRELQSLNWQYNFGANDIGLPISNPFNFINEGYIWSSTSQSDTPENAHCQITNGGSSPALKTRTDIAGAWAVRDVPPPGC